MSSLSDEGDSPNRIVARALDHFIKRLDRLKSDELVMIGNRMIIKDIDANADFCKQLRQRLLDRNTENSIRYKQGPICNALTIYHNDLESSKKALLEKLFDTEKDVVGFDLKHLDAEIKDVAFLLQHYCEKQ